MKYKVVQKYIGPDYLKIEDEVVETFPFLFLAKIYIWIKMLFWEAGPLSIWKLEIQKEPLLTEEIIRGRIRQNRPSRNKEKTMTFFEEIQENTKKANLADEKLGQNLFDKYSKEQE